MRKPKAQPDQKLTEFMDWICAQFVGEAEGSQAFVLAGPATMTVVEKDKGFRQRPINGRTEFLFKKMRRGATGLIAVFEPFDAADYEAMEVKMDRISQHFGPAFEEFFAKTLGAKDLTIAGAMEAAMATYERLAEAAELEEKEKEKSALQAKIDQEQDDWLNSLTKMPDFGIVL